MNFGEICCLFVWDILKLSMSSSMVIAQKFRG